MTGRERILACIENGRADRPPFMPITMMFAADLIGKPYGQYATDYRVLAEGQLRVAESSSTIREGEASLVTPWSLSLGFCDSQTGLYE